MCLLVAVLMRSYPFLEKRKKIIGSSQKIMEL